VLDVGSLDMQAGVSTHDSRTQYKQGNINVSQTAWGAAAGGPSVSGSLSLGEQRDHSTTHTNASLTADGHMDMTVQDDATLVGATVHANEGLTASIGGDLALESVQDLAYGSNQGAGISGGMSFGGVYTNEGGAGADPEQVTLTTARGQGGEASGANAGVNTSNGRYYNKETVLSSLTSGGEVDITVDGHTDITGAVIASIDENGNDTGNLSLTTGSLDFTDLTDTHYSTDSSVSLNTNVLLGDNTTAPPKGVTTQPQDSKGEDQPSGTTNLGLHDSSSYGKDKTLATVGEGTITFGGEEAEPEGLNRDTDSTDKELYSVDRTKADLDVTVDNQTLADAVVALEEVSQFVANLNKMSPEEAAALNDKLGELQAVADTLLNSEDTDKQEAGKKLSEELAGIQESLLAQQALPPEDDRQIADAPALPEKSIEEQAAEFDFIAGEWNDYYEEVQEGADQAFETGVNRGLFAYSQNETTPAFGSDADYEGAISFYQNQRESAYNNLGLDAGAEAGGFSDFLGWTAASVTNESWQAVQFIGKAGAYGVTLGSTSSPLDGSSYHSLIGEDTLFGSPQTFTGAVGVEQGVVASYFVGGEGVLLAGVKGVKYVGAAGRANDVESISNHGGTLFGPHEIGPLGNSNDLRSPASTFRSGSYTEKVAEDELYFYRDYGGKAQVDGRFWTPAPSSGPLQSQLDSAVLPEWGNTFENQAIIKIPAGTKYYEGAAAPQTGTKGTFPALHGGGAQIFVPNPKLEWIDKP